MPEKERIWKAAWALAEKVFYGPRWSWVHPRKHRKGIGAFWDGAIWWARKRGLRGHPNPEHVARAMEEGLKRVEGERVVVLGPYVYTGAIKQMLEEMGKPHTFVDAARLAHPVSPVDPYEFGGLTQLFRAYRELSSAVLDEAVHGVYLAPAKEGKVVFLAHEFYPLTVGPTLGMLARILVRGPLVYTTVERRVPIIDLARALEARVERVKTGTPVKAIVIHPPEDRVAREVLRAIERALLQSHRYGRKRASWADLVARLTASLRLTYRNLTEGERRRFWKYIRELARV